MMAKVVYRIGNLILLMSVIFSCNPTGERTLFESIDKNISGIDFVNALKFDNKFNIYTYRNFYNGGGVAIGDINNDGLMDIYFTANQLPNRLYLNQGNFVFQDITEQAGVKGMRAWSTGVSMADVNGDGWLDIYVCNSGDVKGDNKENELFINNGNLTFTERAKEFGVADPGFSTHAVFFDFDKDSDLDLYILNNSYQAIGSFNLRKNIRTNRDSLGGDKLMRNDNGHFVDVSESAGIYGSVIGFGLGVTVGDINKDTWPDIYVSNDFFERDYLYINKKNGTFLEVLPQQMKSISGASMGADMADFNNDTWPDLFVTEMLPADNARLKTVTTFEDWNRYQYNLENGYYHQFTRNMLQLNNGNNTFSEVGRLAGVEATDWSWGALIFDMDNDGWKDIFVSNGIYQDLTNQDFLQYASSDEFVKSVVRTNSVDYKKLTEIIPSNPVPNAAFQNLGGLKFQNQASSWGLGEPGFSNGSAYGDLDNDGDLDLVVNNVNAIASLYRNNAETVTKNHFAKFKLLSSDSLANAFGTSVTIYAGIDVLYQELMPIKGFQSSVDPRLNFGLGKNEIIDSLLVVWPTGSQSMYKNLSVDQTYTWVQPKVESKAVKINFQSNNLRVEYDTLPYVHKENIFVDFDRDRLTYHKLSTEGPRMAAADIDGNGLMDVYIGGAKEQSGAIAYQSKSGWRIAENDFYADRKSEDLGSVFFDADSDGSLDLYVCSGGVEFSNSSSALLDRLYINNKRGGFLKSSQPLPSQKFESSSVVAAADFDQDGDQDIFVGIRTEPFFYGKACSSYLLLNNGRGYFEDATAQLAPGLKDLGMVTDALWADVDNDSNPDLIVVGEYMAIHVMLNNKGKLESNTNALGLANTSGWWNRIKAADLDGDGDVDFVLGNHGLNSRFKTFLDKPITMAVSDFDGNGTTEQIVSRFIDGKQYPFVLRHDLISQIPSLKKKYVRYEDYKNETVQDIFGDRLQAAKILMAQELQTSVLINNGKEPWRLLPLPIEAQMSPVFGICLADFTGDGHADILLGGNLYGVKPEMGRYDASYGTLLTGNGKGEFTYVPNRKIGLLIDGEVRDMIITGQTQKSVSVLVSRNNQSPLILKFIRE
jgi:enediyne biosynthesis protein E4